MLWKITCDPITAPRETNSIRNHILEVACLKLLSLWIYIVRIAISAYTCIIGLCDMIKLHSSYFRRVAFRTSN
jgi:hypothetical protein